MIRRQFLRNTTASGLGLFFSRYGFSQDSSSEKRRFHVSLSADALLEDRDLLPILQSAGVHGIWMGCYFYGHWPYPIEKLLSARQQVEKAGMSCQIINVPLGHPGDSLGSKEGEFPLTPPSGWRVAQRVDGSTYVGTSLHNPATAENGKALETIKAAGFTRVFLDDDFRLAPSPGQIGGCFCLDHRDRFLQRTGYSTSQWEELLGDVRDRRLSRLMEDWIDFTCDELSFCFQSQQKAFHPGELGIMVMYLGAEKAGIRLADYSNAPFRVGELMFDDNSFGRIKGKTDELFSALFHRRFTRPELAFSETTAFPAESLSASNMSAKLVISTLADVRNTMFMSGVTPFPRSHWETLAPAMKIQASQHQKLAGHAPQGPFKHYWGVASRKIGTDQPFSLFLASGVPFAITDQPAQDGWTFLSDEDARAVVEKKLSTNGTTFIHRSSVREIPHGESCDESLEALFALKERLKPQWTTIPYVEENLPVVCAWYPSAHCVLLWNLSDEAKSLTLVYGNHRRSIPVAGLASALIEDLA